MGTLFCPSVLSFPNEWWESFCKNSPTVNLSATRFVCDETDTKNHNHKFLLITITVVSITSATVLCNWDGMASMSTNSFCQSSLIFHKTALVNCQLEWIVYLNLFFLNQSDPYLIYLQPCLEFRNSGKHWKALLIKPQKTVKRFEIPNMGFHKICA